MHRVEIEQDTEVGDEREEVLDEVEDQWYATIVNNQNIMKENICFHQKLACIDQTMIHKTLQHSWERSQEK